VDVLVVALFPRHVEVHYLILVGIVHIVSRLYMKLR
jgi:hypothetical protein